MKCLKAFFLLVFLTMSLAPITSYAALGGSGSSSSSSSGAGDKPTWGSTSTTFTENSKNAWNIASAVFLIVGAAFAGFGILSIMKSSEQPNQDHAKKGLYKILGGAALMSIGGIVFLARSLFGLEGAGSDTKSFDPMALLTPAEYSIPYKANV